MKVEEGKLNEGLSLVGGADLLREARDVLRRLVPDNDAQAVSVLCTVEHWVGRWDEVVRRMDERRAGEHKETDA